MQLNMRLIMKTLLFSILMLTAFSLSAQVTMYEQEPNNAPDTVNPIQVPVVILGSMENNDQDMFVWEVSDEAAGYSWDLELQGIPDRLTRLDVMQLHFTEDGKGVTKVNKLLALHNRGATAISKTGLVFAPGTYYFGLSYAGGADVTKSSLLGDQLLADLGEAFVQENQVIETMNTKPLNGYQLSISQHSKATTINTSKNSQDRPGKLRTNSKGRLFFDQQIIWLEFNLTTKDAAEIWRISGQVNLGHSIQLDLYNAQGDKLATTSAESLGAFKLNNLKLPAGGYMLAIGSANNALAEIEIQSMGEYIDGNEFEPNDAIKTANHFSIDAGISGLVDQTKDKDFFKFVITEEQAVYHFDIKLINHDHSPLTLCLYGLNQNKLQCKQGQSDMLLSQLLLNQGEYTLGISNGKLNTKYSIEVVNNGIQKSLMEAEPNDRFEEAIMLNQKRVVKGNFNGKEDDFFVFEVGEEAQMWTLQAIGEGISQMHLYNAANQKVQSHRYAKGTKRARISNLNLQPGKHIVQLHGEDSQYIFRAFATGPADASFEAEPNDEVKNAQLIAFDQPKKGLLQNTADEDVYRFHLSSEQGVNLEIQPAADADISYNIYWDKVLVAKKKSAPGEKVGFKGMLQAGDYSVSLKAGKSPSDDVYQLELQPANLMACQLDCEPNDSAHQANLIEPSLKLAGETGTHEDDDWYRLPPFTTETTVTFIKDSGQISHDLDGYINYDKKLSKQLNPEKNQLSFVVPAKQASFYQIHQQVNQYQYQVLINNQVLEAPTQYKDLKLELQKLPQTVTAYSPYAQVIQTQLNIENTGLLDQVVDIEAAVNDHRWRIDFASQNQAIAIKANDRMQIPISINVPNELIRNQQVRLSFAVKNTQGHVSQIWHDLRAAVDVPLIQPKQYWSIDEQLLGGINVAATAMGAQRTAEDRVINTSANGFGFDELFDGITAEGVGLQYRGGRKADHDHITVDLAGDELVNIQGILLNPLSRGKPQVAAKDFDLHLSVDGINFNSVLTGQIKPVLAEQSFVLPQPVPAKFARLYILNSYHDIDRPQTTLGEWKVVASPSQSIGSGFNLANPELGGHVVWASPEPSNSWNQRLLTEKQANNLIRSKANEDWQWVVGFHNQRAAKINKIQWQHATISAAKLPKFKEVKVMTSLGSNVGPWTVVATHQFKNLQDMDEVVFAQPIWARYIKFSIGNDGASTTAYFPETTRVFEAPSGSDYQSILGEWGELSEQAVYELQHFNSIKPSLQDSNNHSKSTAIDLTRLQKATGQVQLEHADKPDWYKIKTQATDNTLKINLSGKQSIETVLEVEDDQGNKMPLITHKKTSNEIEYHLSVNPNQDYFIKITEPPRSVVFVWDTSGSTLAYQPMIYNAIGSYSNAVKADRDVVNFLPFGGQLLMQDWYGNPHYLKTILNNYPRKDNSSSAEESLYKATRALAQRQGSKAIVIITDAITSKYTPMWEAFRTTQPRIFAIGIVQSAFGGNPDQQVDLMQTWSRVNNGDFQRVVNATQVEHAFDRAAVKLRQPADYSIQVSSEYIKAPGPGELFISQAADTQATAVELILDASGSMLKRLNGERRINIAKGVLIDAVTTIIPENTPLALRVFGDKQANACRTDLAIKLNPLNRSQAKKVISQINAKNLAKTPIADSLAQVANDLKSHQGKKIVILVTDGEETCDGDPEQVIAQLIDQGIDVRLNIVGFAINDEELKAQFNQWSVQGGGKYFDSNDPESLKQSVSHALKTPFSVFSPAGELVQEGVVNGQPLQLPAGIYTIKVFGNKTQTFENYHIKGEVTQEIKL